MKIVTRLAVAVVMSSSVHAQWLTYPTAGIPRTADGKPKMDAFADTELLDYICLENEKDVQRFNK